MAPRTNPIKRRIDPQIYAEIQVLALDATFTAAQIRQLVEEDERFADRQVPSSRTFERIVKEFRPDDMSGTWRIGQSRGDDARLILNSLRYISLRKCGLVSFTPVCL